MLSQPFLPTARTSRREFLPSGVYPLEFLPCLLPLLRLRRTSNEFIVSQPLASNPTDYALKATTIVSFPSVEAECFLIKILSQMEWLDIDVSASNRPLQETPEVLNSVGMNMTMNVGYSMVYSLVNILFIQIAVGSKGIGDKVATLFNILSHRIRDCSTAGIGDNLCFNLATTTLQKSHDNNLANATTTFNQFVSLGLMHILSLATYVSLISFYNAGQLAIIAIAHSQADSVKHEPSCLLSDTETSGDFVGTNAILGISNHPDSGKPLVQTDRAILKDCANLDRELLLGMMFFTFPYSTSGYKSDICASASRASHAVRPAQLDHEVQTDIRVREVFDCFNKGSWFFHCCAPFLTYNYMIAQLSYCVKYIIAISKEAQMEKCPRVEIPNIDKLGISIKKGAVHISFEVIAAGPDLLKLIYLQANARPLNVIIESPQAEFDLKITEVNVNTGVIKE